jgi:hypothetical protein
VGTFDEGAAIVVENDVWMRDANGRQGGQSAVSLAGFFARTSVAVSAAPVSVAEARQHAL